MNSPLVMPEEYWANSMLSVARHYGHINYAGHIYIICDKTGRDIFELSEEAHREGRDKAIAPGEPCDLVREDLIPAYRTLGRDRMIALLKQGLEADEIKAEAERIKHSYEKY